MFSVLSTALQGIQREQSRAAEAAHNIANVNTPGFRKAGSDPVIGETPEEQQASNVDLSEEFINLMSAKRGVEANVKVAQVEEEITKSILDIVA